MKILYLCHRTPWPPTKGDKLRAYHQIRLLSRRHEVHLMALEDGSAGDDAGSELGKLCSRVELFDHRRGPALLRCMAATLTGGAFTSAFFWSRSLARAVRRRLRERSYDLVFASTAPMSQYFEGEEGLATVVDLMDVDSRKWQELADLAAFPKRVVFAMEAKRIRRLERRIARTCDRVLLVSSGESRLFEGELAAVPAAEPARATIEVLTNGIEPLVAEPSEPESAQPSLVLVGTMSYLPTVDGARYFVERVFPQLRREFPSLSFSLVGRDPHPSLEALSRVEGVEVTGEVKSIEPYLARAWVFVAPLRTAPGLQNKILEAMSSRVPVVCSRACFEGLCDGGFKAGDDLVVCDDEQDYAREISRLLRSEVERRRMAACAYEKLGVSYDWEAVGSELERIVSSLPHAGGAGQQSPLGEPGAVSRAVSSISHQDAGQPGQKVYP